MRLVVFSDIHGNIYALEEFMKNIRELDYDNIVFLGDIFGYYYHQKDIISRLAGIPDLIWLKGNHDAYAVDVYHGKCDETLYATRFGSTYQNMHCRFWDQEIEFINALPSSVTLEEDDKKIVFFHGTPDDPLEGRLYPKDTAAYSAVYADFDMIILGHTHWRMTRYIDKTIVINPGSLGQPRDGKGFGFAVVDTALRDVRFIDIEIDKSLLYKEIEEKDSSLEKLKEVLERKVK